VGDGEDGSLEGLEAVQGLRTPTTQRSVSVVAVLLGGGPPGLVPAIARDSGLDLAASVCLVADLSVAVAGTGLAHQMA
jgi:hypothetical protein